MTAVEGPAGRCESASAPLSVAVSLEDELDVGRGALICPPAERPFAARELEATVCWLGESPARAGGRYLLKHTTRSERVKLDAVHETLDVATLTGKPGGDSLGLNDIARVSLRCAAELVFDPYEDNRWMGAFILIDEATQRHGRRGDDREVSEPPAPRTSSGSRASTASSAGPRSGTAARRSG